MLEELSKDHKLWLTYAYNICKDRDLSKDLVQDMYLRVDDLSKGKTINNFYVWKVIKNLFITHIKKRKEIPFNELFDLPNEETQILENRLFINDCLDKLPMYQREILLHTHERSLRKNEVYLDIGISRINKVKKTALEELKNIVNEQRKELLRKSR